MIRKTLVLYEHSATFHPSSGNMQSEEAIISPLSGVQDVTGAKGEQARAAGHDAHTLCRVHASTRAHALRAGTK